MGFSVWRLVDDMGQEEGSVVFDDETETVLALPLIHGSEVEGMSAYQTAHAFIEWCEEDPTRDVRHMTPGPLHSTWRRFLAAHTSAVRAVES